MLFTQFDNIRVAGLACAVPSFVQEIDTNPNRADADYVANFVKNTGISRRHISAIRQTSMDLCYGASVKALETAGWESKSIDVVICITYTPDAKTPGNGCLLQYALGMRQGSMAFDMNVACAAFPYAISVAGSLLQSPAINRILVTTSYTRWGKYYLEAIKNGKNDYLENIKADNTFLFGEAGSAILLEKKLDSLPVKLGLWSDGSGFKHLNLLAGARNPDLIYEASDDGMIDINGEDLPPGVDLYMDGYAIMSFTTSTVVKSIKEFIAQIQSSADSYDGVVLHQANLQILKNMARRLGVGMDKVPLSIDKYANTGGTSVFLTIAEAYNQEKRGRESLRLLASGFGAGLTWGVVDFHISSAVVAPVFEYDGIFKDMQYKRKEG